MFKRKRLFGSTVPPACQHCALGHLSADKTMILCSQGGVVSPDYNCRKYEYNPLKRVPHRPAVLPAFSMQDFLLE